MTEIEEIEAMTGLPHVQHTQEFALGLTMWLSMLIALILGTAAWRGRQWWLFGWSVGLAVSVVIYYFIS